MCVFSDSLLDSVKLNENESAKMSVLLKCISDANSDIKLTVISALKICLRFSSNSDVVFLMYCCMSMFSSKFVMSSDVLQYFLMTMLKFFMTFHRVNLSISQSEEKDTDFWMLEFHVICIVSSIFSELIKHEYSVIMCWIRSEVKLAVLTGKLLICR